MLLISNTVLSLSLMWKGMAAIFVVIILIYFATLLLNKGKKKK